jgi:serine/threonine-protein kinase
MSDPDVTRDGLDSVTAPDSGAATLRPGALFSGRYRIEGLIGLGGMGAVYKALDLELNLTVALKTIRSDGPPSSTGDSLARRFKQELLLAREVSHPNILRIHDLGDAGGLKYITMAFVDGVDLAGLLRDAPRLPTERVVALGRQIAAGLAAAHDVGVLHRDLKPQNVLVDARDHVYVSDFGLATSVEMTMAALTRTGEFLGTPRYAAPEQVSGKPLDRRTDIYALGLVLYEMATGAVPFDGGSLLDTMLRRVQERPREPLTINPDVPAFLNRIIMRCLETDPEARYQSAHDVVADLQAGRPPSAMRGSIVSRVRHRFARMTALPWAITAVVLVAGIGVGTVALRRAVVNSRQASDATAAPAVVQRVALLPFKTVGDPAVANAAAGINEALTAKLFQLKGVALASTTAVTRATRKGSLDDVGRDLGAMLLISGTVQGAGDRVRVTASVHQVDRGTTWSQEFSGLTGDLLTLEDQMFAALLPNLGLHPDSGELTRTLAHPTENLDAYGDYLKGRGAMRNEQDLQNVQQAIALYNQALAKDRGFSLAYSGLADASLRMYRATKEPKWASEALSAAQQAQALDDRSLEAHIVLGSVYQATGKNAEALVELRRAVEISPNSDEAHRRLGRAYLATGRRTEGIEAYKKAVAVNPYHWVNNGTLGAAYMQVGDYDHAIDAFKKVIEIAPDNVNGYNDLGAAYLQVGRYGEAIAALGKALGIQKIPNTYTNLAIAYASAGRFDEAVPMFEEAVKLQPQSEQFVGNLGDGYRWAGRTADAAATYDRAIGLALKALQINPRDAATKGNLALYYAKKGDSAQARKLMSDARAIDAANAGLIYSEAVMHGLAGNNDAALASLERAVKAGYPASAANGDPDLRRLREDPRYRQVVTPAARPSS